MADQTAVTDAQHALDGAILLSPTSGTVGDIGVAAGQTAAAGAGITILGAGAVDVTAQVPLTSIPLLRVGGAATVVADGAPAPLQATVQSIGLLPTATTPSPTYPVVVVVPTPSPTLTTGATAEVDLTLATARGVVTVPTSALTPTGTGTATVTVLDGTTTSTTTVHTGAIGTATTEITAGVDPGTQVVLADPTQPLPSNSTTTTRGGFGGGRAGGGAGGAGGAGRPSG